ncbi:conserved Plasmodium protein, unknown function [Plasmodium gallinaceum]|uniref:Uncharacterized protein n=1 Tax=Plasmodium gallinaceum TaxID=5849 RepID=A0A1J1GUK1_PLAGA|nr:conserved Plasmodium protein, unknown function [Plasmodium gallinaceum]CRG96217.1 conserved Plasmodium protein, unknown function [Plasmodium gallinaceum]
MSYNKTYGGQFMGLSSTANTNNQQKINEKKAEKKIEKKEQKNAEKVIFALSDLRGINISELQNGEIFFFCTIIFDNNDVKLSMEKSNHNSSLILGEYLHSSYSLTFSEEIVLNIPQDSNFARCYVSCITVTESDGKRNIKLEGIGYTDPFPIKECKVYGYANCKLNTAVGAPETQGILKMCVKCVENTHPSIVKPSKPYNAIEEIKQRYEN